MIRTASSISAVCTAADMAMNAVLIQGLFGAPKMEIAGAALSTSLTRALELVWCVAASSRCRVKLKLKAPFFGDKRLVADFWKYTSPVLANEIVWGVGFSVYSVIMGHLGKDAVAANSVANIVKNLLSCLCLGVANGGAVLVGNLLGEGDLQTAKSYGGKLCRIAILCGVASGAVLLALTPFVIKFAALNALSSEYLTAMLIICSYYMIGLSVNNTTVAGIFCAGGDSKFGFICDVAVIWCVVIPLGFISAFVLKLPVVAVYFILSLDEFIKLPAVYINYKKYKWVKNLTVKEKII